MQVPSDNIKVLDMEKKIDKARKDHDVAKLSKDNALDKAQRLKYHMRSDAELTDEEYLSIMNEVHEYEMSLKDAVHKMEHSQATFLGAHSSTLEVLNIAGETWVSDERFHKAGERKFQCMFCTKRFDELHVCKHHILMYHWKDWDSKVSNMFIHCNNLKS